MKTLISKNQNAQIVKLVPFVLFAEIM